MMRIRPRCAAVSLCLLLLVCAACSKTDSRRPTYPVSGQVHWKKRPAANALVILRPVGKPRDADWPQGFPRGRVKADGGYEVMTYEEGDGAPEGEYVVLIQWPRAVSSGEREEADLEDRLGGRYSVADLSPFRVRVHPGGNDPREFTFHLK